MIYFLAVLGMLLSISSFIGLYIYLFGSKKLGYLKYFVLGYTYSSLLGFPLTYGAFGTLWQWPKGAWIYEHMWWIYLIQIIIAMFLYFSWGIYDKHFKS